MKNKPTYRIVSGLLLVALLFGLMPLTGLAQGKDCEVEYTAQANDWLSKIAEKYLGNKMAYPAIVEATNKKNASDSTFAKITDPNLIEVGYKLCVPSAEAAQAMLAASGASQGGATATEAAQPKDLNVFAAASLTEPFKEIGKKFEAANPGVKVVFNFAGSQQLAQQITQGAPADVFASANKKQMDVVITSGQVISGTEKLFVKNRLVVIYPKDNPAKLSTLPDLAKSDLKLILADKAVPVGQYALDFLDKANQDAAFGAGYKDNVIKNVVSYEQDVKAVLSKVTLGEGDAGIVYTTDISLDAADKVGKIDIPDNLNVIASYPIAEIKESKQPETAKLFVDYILASDAQEILNKYGFLSAK